MPLVINNLRGRYTSNTHTHTNPCTHTCTHTCTHAHTHIYIETILRIYVLTWFLKFKFEKEVGITLKGKETSSQLEQVRNSYVAIINQPVTVSSKM